MKQKHLPRIRVSITNKQRQRLESPSIFCLLSSNFTHVSSDETRLKKKNRSILLPSSFITGQDQSLVCWKQDIFPFSSFFVGNCQRKLSPVVGFRFIRLSSCPMPPAFAWSEIWDEKAVWWEQGEVTSCWCWKLSNKTLTVYWNPFKGFMCFLLILSCSQRAHFQCPLSGHLNGRKAIKIIKVQ